MEKKKIEYLFKARRRASEAAPSSGGKKNKQNMHPVMTVVHGPHGTYQAIRWQSLEDTNHEENQKPTAEQQNKIENMMGRTRTGNAASFAKNWSLNKFRQRYLEIVKEENDAKRAVDAARASGNAATLKAMTKEYNKKRAIKSQIKAAADIRQIDLDGFLKKALETLKAHRQNQGESARYTPTTENTESLPAEAIPGETTVVDGRVVFTATQSQFTGFNESSLWAHLTDDEDEAFANATFQSIADPTYQEKREVRQITWNNGDYDGEVVFMPNGSSVPDGEGKWTSRVIEGVKKTFEGRYKHGIYNGPGKLTAEKKNGTPIMSYEGGFINNLYDGVGTLINYDDSGEEVSRYTGAFRAGQASGIGVLTTESTVERGNFIDGRLSGRGSVENQETGEYTEGLFANGQPNGRCTVRQSDGTTTEGVYRQGLRNGKFVTRNARGNEIFSYYNNGQEISAAEYRRTVGVNAKSVLEEAGWETRGYDEETTAASFSGIDLPAIMETMKSQFRGVQGAVMASSSPGGATLNFSCHFGGGEGTLTRTFVRTAATGKLLVKHDYFKIPDSEQRGGKGKVVMKELLNQYKTMGVDNVEVSAGLDGGAYTWALYGFYCSDGAKYVHDRWLNPETAGRQKLNRFINDVGQEKYQALLKLVNSWPRAKPFPMHVIANMYGASGKAGSDLLRGQPGWHGTIDMHDPEQVKIWENYVNPVKQSEREQKRNEEMAIRAAEVKAERKAAGSRGGRRRVINENL